MVRKEVLGQSGKMIDFSTNPIIDRYVNMVPGFAEVCDLEELAARCIKNEMDETFIGLSDPKQSVFVLRSDYLEKKL